MSAQCVSKLWLTERTRSMAERLIQYYLEQGRPGFIDKLLLSSVDVRSRARARYCELTLRLRLAPSHR